MAAEQHALLSPSSSHRWLNCPPSVRLGETCEKKTSTYAEAGRLAHAIAELKTRKYFCEPMSAKDYQASMKLFRENSFYEKDMDENTDLYLDHLKALAMSYGETTPFVAPEVQLYYKQWVQDGFGTADCVMFGKSRIDVIDYKNGSGVAVEAEENSQMKIYALGVLETYKILFCEPIKTIHLSIVQPNSGGIKEWETSTDSLLDWAEKVVKPTAALAWAGEGDFHPGPWCDNAFCPARGKCRARAEQLLKTEPLLRPLKQKKASDPDPKALLSNEEIGNLLAKVQGIPEIIKDLEKYALNSILKGEKIPGFKAVNGRSSREWDGGPEKAFATLMERGVPEAMLWTRDPITAPALEKALGKKAFTDAAKGLVKIIPGKPSLDIASSRKKEYMPAANAFKPVANQAEDK